jgi:hypothetical protein
MKISKFIIFCNRYVENLGQNLLSILKEKYDCDLKIRQIVENDIKMLKECEYLFIITPHSVISKSVLPALVKCNYFIFQTEQVNTVEKSKKYLHNGAMKIVMQYAKKIYDYSFDNMNFYSNFLKVEYMPFVCNAKYYEEKEKSIDLLFYGTLNYRRYIILESLKQLFPDITIEIYDKLFGQELKEKIKKSKIILNLHYYENSVLETARIFEALNYNVHIISENNKEENIIPNTHFVKDFGYYDQQEMETITINKSKFQEIETTIKNLLKKSIDKKSTMKFIEANNNTIRSIMNTWEN